MDDNFVLNSKEQLQLHQLQIADYWQRKQHIANTANDEDDSGVSPHAIPSKWRLTKNVSLYSWQAECMERYTGKGIAKVVTGAGKTIFALALAERLQNQHRNLKVLIVVPSIVLMEQWFDAILKHGNLPESTIGRLGGGYSDSLEDRPLLIGVCNSVALRAEQWRSRYREQLFLIADECHRYRGEVMRKVFEMERRFSLGLSATPDVEFSPVANDGDDDRPEITSEADAPDALLKQELGEIFYTLNYDDAVKAGFLPEFEIQHVGLPLQDEETRLYRKVSDEITELRDRLFAVFPDAPRGGELSGWATMKLRQSKVPDDLKSLCAGYIAKVAERKTLIYHAQNRETAVVRLLKERLKQNKKTQAILFHERIDEVMRLYLLLQKNGISAVPEHSQLSDSLREKSIELFRCGLAKVIVSGKALIEGFDAPSADIGINVASSGSRTKAIQSIGRVLRKNNQDADKLGLIVRFYISNTMDAFLYKKTDFSIITGARRNRYFLWDPSDTNAGINDNELPGPPFTPLPKENSLNWTEIVPGATLEFDADGEEYQIDGRDNIFRKSASNQKEFVTNPQNISALLSPYRKMMRNSYFRQTSTGRIFLRQYNAENDLWQWLYCGRILNLFQLGEPIAGQNHTEEIFKLAQFRGRKIIRQAKAVNGVARNIPEPHAAQILEAIDRLPAEIRTGLNNIYIIGGKDVFCRFANAKHEICSLSSRWSENSKEETQ